MRMTISQTFLQSFAEYHGRVLSTYVVSAWMSFFGVQAFGHDVIYNARSTQYTDTFNRFDNMKPSHYNTMAETPSR